MMEKMIVLILVFGSTLIHDVPRFAQNERRGVIVYGLLMAMALYLAVDWLLEIKLPSLIELLDWTLSKPAKRIGDYLQNDT